MLGQLTLPYSDRHLLPFDRGAMHWPWKRNPVNPLFDFHRTDWTLEALNLRIACITA